MNSPISAKVSSKDNVFATNFPGICFPDINVSTKVKLLNHDVFAYNQCSGLRSRIKCLDYYFVNCTQARVIWEESHLGRGTLN